MSIKQAIELGVLVLACIGILFVGLQVLTFGLEMASTPPGALPQGAVWSCTLISVVGALCIATGLSIPFDVHHPTPLSFITAFLALFIVGELICAGGLVYQAKLRGKGRRDGQP
jgi:hypothetical protein